MLMIAPINAFNIWLFFERIIYKKTFKYKSTHIQCFAIY